MPGIIKSRENSKPRKMAERFVLSEFNNRTDEPNLPKSWKDVPLFLTAECVAGLLGIREELVAKWCRAGKLKAIKRAGKWFIPKENFMLFMEVGLNGNEVV